LNICKKFVQHIQVSIKSHKNNGTSHTVQYTVLSYLPQFSYNEYISHNNFRGYGNIFTFKNSY